MSEQITSAMLDELERLEREATPAPWENDSPSMSGDSIIAPDVPGSDSRIALLRYNRLPAPGDGVFFHNPIDREYVIALRNNAPALLAAARRAERYEAALRSIYDEVRFAAKADPIAHELRETVEWVRDTVHATVWGGSPPAALTPEPPQSRPSGAHSPEAGGGV